jgi:UDP-3-O-[3-hydroxymyristoyl] glucosamine N-acyltransferase
VALPIAGGSLAELVSAHGGRLDGALASSISVRSIGASDRGEACDLAPVLHDRGANRLLASARVWLVAEPVASRVPEGSRWIHPRADRVLAALLATSEVPSPSSASVSFRLVSGAHVAEGVAVPSDACIEPGAVIFPNVRLGARVRIGASAVVGRVGFGFVDDERGVPVRVPHLAGVVLRDGVEIGAHASIDAGILAPTELGEETKLDAHVHVGHGVVVGARCRMAAQVGLAGSVVVEDDVWIGGQAGIADHCRIGRGARIAAKAGVIGDVPAGAVFAGYPAVARARWLRGHAKLYRG